MPSRRGSELGSGSAKLFDEQLPATLRDFAAFLEPIASALNPRFHAKLKALGFKPEIATELLGITPGAAALILSRNADLPAFFSTVEQVGERLAKLNVPPQEIVGALREYDRLLMPFLKRLPVSHQPDYERAREQIYFGLILTINEAYYNVRESETHALHEISKIEFESKNTDVLFRGFLETLADLSHAPAGHLFLCSDTSELLLRASTATAISEKTLASVRSRAPLINRLSKPCYLDLKTSTAGLLDPGWAGRFPACWSFPMFDEFRLAGVLQLGMPEKRKWLPRDEELILTAVARCLRAAEKTRLVEGLAYREEQVRRLAEHMLHVEEMERRRISRELHDEAGQSLVCIRLQMELVEMSLTEGNEELVSRLAEIRDVTERTILDMRRLIADLSPVILEQFGLNAALRQLAKRLESMHSCEVQLSVPENLKLPPKLDIIIYRILQECCNNIGKHSFASLVNISVSSADGVLSLVVTDNGVGFCVEEALTKTDSFGLAGIRERVALLDGKLNVSSKKARRDGKRVRNHGTQVSIKLPLRTETNW